MSINRYFCNTGMFYQMAGKYYETNLKEATQQGTTEGRQLTAIVYLQIGIQPSSHWSPP